MELKEYSELTLCDDFLFGHVMEDSNLCKQLLEIILGVKIRKIVYIKPQETVMVAIKARGIRLDVYVEDDQETIYNIEMQTTNPGNLPRRTRYYQGVIDINSLHKGVDYDELNNCFIIFICTNDIFHKDRFVYTFQNICVEEPGLKLGDGTTKIFLNINGSKGDISLELAAFLHYLKTGDVSDEYTNNLSKAVAAAKNNEEWEAEYVRYYADLMDKFKEGKSEGLAEGDNIATIRSLRGLMNKSKCSLDEAMETLDVPSDMREFCRNVFQKKTANG